MPLRVLLACLLALLLPPESHAASRAKRCKVMCRETVLVCVVRAAELELAPDLRPRARKRALRQLTRRCRGGLLARCRKNPAVCLPTTTTTSTTTSTTSTTSSTTTTTSTSTTTTMPDPLVGDWRFTGEGSETCAAWELTPNVAVSFHLERKGTELTGRWFLDEPAPGAGMVTGTDSFDFDLTGPASHFLCPITSLTLTVEDFDTEPQATLSVTAVCQGEDCGGEWTGTIEKRPISEP